MIEGVSIVLNKRIKWKRMGDANNPTLVLLHGLGNNMSQWKDVEERLSQYFDIFMFDLIGFGGSDDFEETELNISFPIWLMDELFTEFGIKKPILLGESFGGLLALEYTLKRQENVSKLVLMDSAGLGREICLKYRLSTLPVLGEAFVSEDANYPGVEGIPIKPGSLFRIFSNIIRFAFVKIILRRPIQLDREEKNNLKLLRHGVNLFGQKPTIRRDKKLKQLKIPVLVLHGLEDVIFPLLQPVKAFGVFPNTWGNFPIFFKGGGHNPLNLDRYKDKLLAKENIEKFVVSVIEFGLA